jgi:hypothetical protein
MLKETDYPSSYLSANNASIIYKKKYFSIKAVEYIFVIIAAIVSIIPVSTLSKYDWASAFAGISFLGALLAIFYEKNLNFRRGWFISRAAAEEILSEFFKYMTSVDMYSPSMDEKVAKTKYYDYINRVKTKLRLEEYLANYQLSANEITEVSTTIRNSSLRERIQFYKDTRLKDQEKWYILKAKLTEQSKRRLLIISLLFLVLGIFLSSLKFMGNLGNNGLLAICSAIIASVSGWYQLNDLDTQSISYSKASQDIGFESLNCDMITTQEELEKLVINA